MGCTAIQADSSLTSDAARRAAGVQAAMAMRLRRALGSPTSAFAAAVSACTGVQPAVAVSDVQAMINTNPAAAAAVSPAQGEAGSAVIPVAAGSGAAVLVALIAAGISCSVMSARRSRQRKAAATASTMRGTQQLASTASAAASGAAPAAGAAGNARGVAIVAEDVDVSFPPAARRRSTFEPVHHHDGPSPRSTTVVTSSAQRLPTRSRSPVSGPESMDTAAGGSAGKHLSNRHGDAATGTASAPLGICTDAEMLSASTGHVSQLSKSPSPAEQRAARMLHLPLALMPRPQHHEEGAGATVVCASSPRATVALRSSLGAPAQPGPLGQAQGQGQGNLRPIFAVWPPGSSLTSASSSPSLASIASSAVAPSIPRRHPLQVSAAGSGGASGSGFGAAGFAKQADDRGAAGNGSPAVFTFDRYDFATGNGIESGRTPTPVLSPLRSPVFAGSTSAAPSPADAAAVPRRTSVYSPGSGGLVTGLVYVAGALVRMSGVEAAEACSFNAASLGLGVLSEATADTARSGNSISLSCGGSGASLDRAPYNLASSSLSSDIQPLSLAARNRHDSDSDGTDDHDDDEVDDPRPTALSGRS